MFKSYKIPGLKYNTSKDEVMLTAKYDDTNPVTNVSTIVLNPNCFCNHALHAWGDITINQGAIIVGSVQSDRNLTIYPGIGEDGQATSIVGDVICDHLQIALPPTGAPSSLVVIQGNVYVESAEFEAEVFIRGNLFVKSQFTSKNWTFVAGRTKIGHPQYLGKAKIEKFGTFGLYAFGILEIGSSCSVLEPIITVNPASGQPPQLRFSDGVTCVRVISAPCFNCVTKDFLRCTKMEDCWDYSVLTKEDLFHLQETNSYYLSWYWRALPETVLHHYFIEEFYRLFLVRHNQDEIRFMLNNPTSFTEIYSRLMGEIQKIKTDLLTIQEWLDSRGVDSKEVFQYMNWETQQTLHEVYKTPTATEVSAGEAILPDVGSPVTVETASTDIPQFPTAGLLYAGEFSVENLFEDFPKIFLTQNLRETDILAEQEQFTSRIEQLGSFSEIVQAVDIVEVPENPEHEKGIEDLITKCVQCTQAQAYVRDHYPEESAGAQREFQRIHQKIRSMFEQLVIQRLSIWNELFGIQFNAPQAGLRDEKVPWDTLTNRRLQYLKRVRKYLRSIMNKARPIDLLSDSFEAVLQGYAKKIKQVVKELPRYLKDHPPQRAKLEIKNLLIKYRQVIEDGSASIKYFSVLERLVPLARAANLPELARKLEEQKSKVEKYLRESTSTQKEVRDLLKECKMALVNGQDPVEIEEQLQQVLLADITQQSLVPEDRALVEAFLTKIYQIRTDLTMTRLSAIEDLARAHKEILYGNLLDPLRFNSEAELKQWLEATIAEYDLAVRLTPKGVVFLTRTYADTIAQVESDMGGELKKKYEEWGSQTSETQEDWMTNIDQLVDSFESEDHAAKKV